MGVEPVGAGRGVRMSDAFGPTVHVAAAARNCVSHVRIGIPLPRGWVDEVRLLSASVPQAQEAAGGAVAMQGRVLARWPDRSIKWLLTDLAVGSRLDDQVGGHSNCDCSSSLACGYPPAFRLDSLRHVLRAG